MITTSTMNIRKPGRTWIGNPNRWNAGSPAMEPSLRRSGAPPGSTLLLDSRDVPYVYSFSHKHRRPPMEYKDLLGGKGANLAEMTSVLKLPVPPGFTISTDACRAYMHGGWPAELDQEIAQQVAQAREDDGPQARRSRATRCSSASAPARSSRCRG